jgi:hypothetical protein
LAVLASFRRKTPESSRGSLITIIAVYPIPIRYYLS